MITLSLGLFFLVAAAISFLLSGFTVPTGRVNTFSLGWFFVICWLIVGGK